MSNYSPSIFSGSSLNNINSSTNITQSFRDQKQIESFVRSNNLLKIIEEAAERFVKTYQLSRRPEDALTSIIIVLPFVFGEFLTVGTKDLLHFAIEEPLLFEEATKYCVYGIVREFIRTFPESGLKTVDITQVHVQIRFINVPLQDSLTFDPSKNQFSTGLCIIFGVLSAVTEKEKHVLQSVWYCSAGCIRNKIKSCSIDAPLCPSCSRPMSEYSKLRSAQNSCLLRVLPVACVQTPRIRNKIFRSIKVRAKDHIYDCELSLGSRYLITGYYNYYSNGN